MTSTGWRIRVGAEAEKDFLHILKYTRDTFGEQQTEIYRATILEALSLFDHGPDISGSVDRSEILLGLRTIHIARKGRRGRHFIMYRASGDHVIDVIRILHEAMDLARHIPWKSD